MSRDNQISQQCSHVVREEVLTLQDDRQTIRPLRPIGNAASIRIRMNGLVGLPSEGVKLPARVQSKTRGPFTISPSDNVLDLEVNGQGYQLRVTPGQKIPSAKVARELSETVPDLVVTEQNGYLLFQTKSVGRWVSLVVRGGGMVGVLGLVAPRVWRGSIQQPGWTLVHDPLTLGDRPTRLVVFDAPLPGYQPVLEMDYSTIQQECRRCGGLGTESDWVYLSNGDKAAVRDSDLMMQEVMKFSFTIKGSNRFHTWYGTSMLDAIGKKLSNAGLVQNLIVSELYEGFRRWQSLKRQQEEAVGQYVSDQEFPQRVVSVTLEPSTTDPTVVFVNATIQSRANKVVPLSRAVRLPYLLDFTG
jgi:hypothetical protein